MSVPRSTPLAGLRVVANKTALLIVDVQTKLAAAMPQTMLGQLERNIELLLTTAHRLGIPVIRSEQYPKGLGPTVPAIANVLDQADVRCRDVEKLTFSCAGAPGFGALFAQLDRPTWLVVGMETHVCVWQTVHDLITAGAIVHVPEDAVLSRHEVNHRRGLQLMAHAGAVVTTTETVVFDALGEAGTPDFKALSQKIRNR